MQKSKYLIFLSMFIFQINSLTSNDFDPENPFSDFSTEELLEHYYAAYEFYETSHSDISGIIENALGEMETELRSRGIQD